MMIMMQMIIIMIIALMVVNGDDDVLSPQRSGLRIELQNAAVVATAHISFTSPNISTPRSDHHS